MFYATFAMWWLPAAMRVWGLCIGSRAPTTGYGLRSCRIVEHVSVRLGRLLLQGNKW